MPSPDPTTKPDIALFVSDVDGSLLTSGKAITEKAHKAVRDIKQAGIAFSITSGRPPKGMAFIIKELGVTLPVSAFNGGLFMHPDLTIIDEHWIPINLVAQIVEQLKAHKLDPWVYTAQDWFLRSGDAAHVAKEIGTVHFKPTIVADPVAAAGDAHIIKITGASDDYDAVARAETDLREIFGAHVSANRSQPYYLDVTHPDGNKGQMIETLSKYLDIPTHKIATLGDMPNDVSMFKKSGYSIAMGQSDPQVQAQAHQVTQSNNDEGFAYAVEHFILGAKTNA